MTHQMDLTNIYRILYSNSTGYTFYSVALRNFFKIDHVLGHKTNLKKQRKNGITSCIKSTHDAVKIKINRK